MTVEAVQNELPFTITVNLPDGNGKFRDLTVNPEEWIVKFKETGYTVYTDKAFREQFQDISKIIHSHSTLLKEENVQVLQSACHLGPKVCRCHQPIPIQMSVDGFNTTMRGIAYAPANSGNGIIESEPQNEQRDPQV
jgi:hypothetical protein